MPTIAELEQRVQAAQEAQEAAKQRGDQASVQLHAYRAFRAGEKLIDARIEQGEI